MPTPARPATLLYNAAAGSQRRASPDALHHALLDADYDAEVWLTTRPEDVIERLPHITGTLFIAGGDGTLRAAALHALHRPDLILGVLPLGTANNVARAWSAMGDPLEVARSYRDAAPAPFDVGRVRGQWGEDHFLEACGCGLFAEVLDDYNPHAPKSPVRALGSIFEALTTLHPLGVRVTVDGEAVPSPPALLLEVMNTPSTGNGLHLAPQATPGDGRLDLVRVDATRHLPLFQYGRAMLGGTFDTLPSVSICPGRSFTVADHGQVFHVDTELRRSHEPGGTVQIDVVPGALSVLRPRP
ncbi:diacylglycerol kinase family protein [uncultured Deinococcus sp.]|uniref:diacylglycerol/lipid kinase family protein n=1 Tax=uncultured Deinococcus sp. TaxID=158789 RepID=UPI0025D0FDB1|nr:diacylglycerol kinase family protein [uncultured Deinococcus sp.]